MDRDPVSPLVARTVNGLLDRLPAAGAPLPAEAELAKALGISRSPLRRAFAWLREGGILRDSQQGLVVARRPRAADRFPETTQPDSKSAAFVDVVLGKLTRGDLRPGQHFSELELAREAGLSTVPVREALLAVGAVGLIAKEPRHRWTVVRFSQAMVDELYDLRLLLELEVLGRAMAASDEHPVRAELESLQAEHQRMSRGRRDLDRYLDLDLRFHGALFAAGANRFISQQFANISTLLRFHSQSGENGVRGMDHGLEQHPRIIAAVLGRDAAAGRRHLRDHLAFSRNLMKDALASDD